MTTDPKVLRGSERDRWYGSPELAFGGVAKTRPERELWAALTETERPIGVRDGGNCVCTAGRSPSPCPHLAERSCPRPE